MELIYFLIVFAGFALACVAVGALLVRRNVPLIGIVALTSPDRPALPPPKARKPPGRKRARTE